MARRLAAALVAVLIAAGGCAASPDQAASDRAAPDSAAPDNASPDQATPGDTDGALACPAGTSCGVYAVPGLGDRKAAIREAGGDTLAVAVAMLETDGMDSDYPYGDGKTDDAANFGVFKQNWHMLRHACRRFEGQSVDQWNNGAVLNRDLAADVQCLTESQRRYGLEAWFAGHRNGETGLHNPDTTDIDRYRTAVLWMHDRLAADPANLTNDLRYWVEVPAI